MQHYNKTNKLKNLVKKVAIGGTLVGLLIAGNCEKKYEQASEIYRGWTGISGRALYKFDSQPASSRFNKNGKEREANYVLAGGDSLKSLKIGKRYSIKIKSSYLPWAVEEIESIKEEGEK